MGWFRGNGNAYEEAQSANAYANGEGDQHQGSWSHELVGGAAAFEAMRLYEKKKESEGVPEDHMLAKEMVAGFAGAEADKLIETKGLDYVDREKAKRHAQQEAVAIYDQQYANY